MMNDGIGQPLRFEVINAWICSHEIERERARERPLDRREIREEYEARRRVLWDNMRPAERIYASAGEEDLFRQRRQPAQGEPESEPSLDEEEEEQEEPQGEIPDENANERRRPRRTNRTIIPDFFDHRLRQRVGIIPRDDDMEETISI